MGRAAVAENMLLISLRSFSQHGVDHALRPSGACHPIARLASMAPTTSFVPQRGVPPDHRFVGMGAKHGRCILGTGDYINEATPRENLRAMRAAIAP